jgi:endogenous inhibitor of DNA gyrase (YacG/DUF329 family)
MAGDRPKRELVCNICQAALPPRESNPAFPFCSDRCQLIDLGRWLDGAYRVPEPATPADADFMMSEFPGAEPDE